MALIRDIHAATLAALRVDGFHPVLMVRVDWPGGEVRAHTGFGVISWGGDDWAGIGPFGGGELPEEELGGAVPAEARLFVMGTIEDLLDQLDVNVRNRDVDIFVALVTEAQGNILIGEPVELLSGYADSNELDWREAAGALAPTFALGVCSGPSVRTVLSDAHSDEDQQRRYSGDTIFRHTALSDLNYANPPIWPEP